jgi:hypothetical protein
LAKTFTAARKMRSRLSPPPRRDPPPFARRFGRELSEDSLIHVFD